MDRNRVVSDPGQISRRAALRASGAGLAVAFGAEFGPAAAQEPSPAAAEPVPVLLVQSFDAGTIVPNREAADHYTVTLERGVGRTVVFTDRPERLAGSVSTEDALAAMAATGDDPPNAALLADQPGAEATIWVVTLLTGTYDAEAGRLTYEVRIVDPAAESTRFAMAPAPAPTASQDLGAGHLFIDHFPVHGVCYIVTTGHYSGS